MTNESPNMNINAISQDTLTWLLDLAYDDQQNYLHYGKPGLDYGDEWQDVLRDKVRMCREISKAAWIHGERERWSRLADQFEEQLEELTNDNR